MNYHHLYPSLHLDRVRVALVGARGAYGRSLLVRCRKIPSMMVVALCDLDLDGLEAMLPGIGYPDTARCATPDEVRAAQAARKVVLVSDHALLDAAAVDVTVEATGQPEVACRVAEAAIARGNHVVMVTKECDSVAGAHLRSLAVAKGVVHTMADGDQPANLVELVTWARTLGFDVVAAGKSSEYDYIIDPATGTVSWLDRVVDGRGIGDLWDLGHDVHDTLGLRSAALGALPQRTVPDYTEMSLVADATGLMPSSPLMGYPMCRITELADVFGPRAEGGILDRTGVVDVFNCLRRADEPSLGGGVFVVVACDDPETWEVLRGKGHVVSRDCKRACIYRPYHLLGFETPLTIIGAALAGVPVGDPGPGAPSTLVAALASRDFKAGETLALGGHHHTVDGLEARLLELDASTATVAPFYLVAGKTLTADVRAGTTLRPGDVDLDGSALAGAWETALRLRGLPSWRGAAT